MLEGIATFTATEIISFSDFIFLTVVLSLVALDRPTLRSKVLHSPEVLQVVEDMPHVKEFMRALYHCQYKNFMINFADVAKHVQRSRHLSGHFRYFLRNMRLVAYSQFLESYRSVTLKSMSTFFGVSEDFIDREISSFIASGKLVCKIDKVGGTIESNQLNSRNALYAQALKQGDSLLNRIQKLSRVIDM
eukprot:GHVL01024143.1.p1 GENE.GHVL01024143.1~~GHVL01024143.1.p1  ORF type:complete len:190 (+),score=13.90 GHVL01024143.1:121-690(+)